MAGWRPYVVLPLVLAVPTVATLAAHRLWGHWEHVGLTLHSAVEAAGALSALIVAAFLLQRGERTGPSAVAPAVGFAGMGVFGAFHAASLPGHGFVLLHSLACIAGGVGFATAWLPRATRACGSSLGGWILPIVALPSAVLSILVIARREWFPVMLQNGEFTRSAVALNVAGGCFYVLSVVYLAREFHRTRDGETHLFACMAGLFAVAGFMFPYSRPWDDAWWAWHVVRLAAFLVALGLLNRNYLGMLGDLRASLAERERADAEVRSLNATLERRVTDRTAELDAANKELEAFSYSVSHDLRSPLRAIDGFSLALVEDYGDRLDAGGKDYLVRVRDETQRMGRLIDDLLRLSRVTRSEIVRERVDLTALAESVAGELRRRESARRVEFVVGSGLTVEGDRQLLTIAIENLLGNAWKFTGRREAARVEFGASENGGERAFHVRDNGAGFDMRYASKLFAPFQRLHSVEEFAGTGVGLATVHRIVRRHGGRVWAEGEVGKGATFYFTLPQAEGSGG